MASRILGVDLGAYSVKVLVASPGFRHASVIQLIERPVPRATSAEDEPHAVRAARVLGQIVRERGLTTDTAYAAIPGDKVFTHILEFGFRNLRRPDLEKAVGAELEGILPVDMEDMVYAFEPVPGQLGQSGQETRSEPGVAAADAAAPDDAGTAGGPVMGRIAVSDDDPTNVQGGPRPGPPGPRSGATMHGRIAPPAEGMRVLACAMETERAQQLIALMGEHAVEPRGLVAAPGAYARVAERLISATSAPTATTAATTATGTTLAGTTEPVAIIDIGHERTDVCVVAGGKAVYARTIVRGGLHVTQAIMRAWGLSFEESERAKHADGFVASRAEPATSPDWQRIHQIVVTEVEPMARELKRTLQSCRAKTGATVHRAVLVGGGSRLRGLASFMAEKLRMPVTTLSTADAIALLGEPLVTGGVPADIACLAAGVAMEGSGGRPHFDLRQGPLAYRADLSFLREKAPFLAAAVLAIIAFAVIEAYASLYKLRSAEETLKTRLALETTEVFGDPLSASDALERTQGTTQSQKLPLPKMTAYDILLEMNSKLPERGKVKVDVKNLDIKQGKITFEATTESSAQIDEIEEAFKSITCFEDISRGNTTTGSTGEREFSFSIKSNCM